MVEPIRHELGGDPQGRSIFHQTHIAEIGDLGTANAEINPSHHIAQDTLSILFQFMGDLFIRELLSHQRRFQQQLDLGCGPHGQLHLTLGDVHVVVVQAVQRGRGWGGHPGRTGSGHELGNLAIQHVLHTVRLGPHALSNLGLSLQSTMQSNVHISRLIGLNPVLLLHISLSDHRASKHARVDLVSGTIKEAGVDEEHSF
mmetsp:Transcript_87333/g.138597  ORF Transcript_87333/g.138597 Transcript_87333/m.138597 type:complete len:200 (+) Transcript_87333:499-1098(+)